MVRKQRETLTLDWITRYELLFVPATIVVFCSDMIPSIRLIERETKFVGYAVHDFR